MAAHSKQNGTDIPENEDINRHILEMKGITKRFPGVVANDAVDLSVEKGEIHALLGENGAGKSTLMKILYGLYEQDAGQIYFDGELLDIDSPQEATEIGIGMVHQHFMLIPRLTVVENIVLGARETPFDPDSLLGRLAKTKPFGSLIKGLTRDLDGPRAEIETLMDDYGMELDLDKQIWELEVGERQRVEILKALYRDVDLLILDEPTAVLSPTESQALFETLSTLTDEGLTVLLITHKLHEVTGNADRVTVLRDGTVVNAVTIDDVTESDLAEMMVGREVLFQLERERMNTGEVIADISGVSAEDDRGIEAVRDLNLKVNKGEIVGVAGVSGNGQRELAECLVGLREPTSGKIIINNTRLHGKQPRAFIDADVSYIPEDRYNLGCTPDRSVLENLILKNYQDFSSSVNFDYEQARAYAEELVEEFDVRTPDLDTPVNKLSGGNLQKLICARELSRDPAFLVANQPTRGIDVGAIEYIRSVLLEQRKDGTGILLISEDLDEVFQISDRIVVMYDGEIVYRTEADDASREVVGQYITAGEATTETDHTASNQVTEAK